MKSEALFLIKKGAAEQAFERRAFELPKLEPNELLVESEAFGLNYADVMARNGLYREAPPMPCASIFNSLSRVQIDGVPSFQSNTFFFSFICYSP